jgi:hypothetical protein
LADKISGLYEKGADIKLIARSNPGYVFDKWLVSSDEEVEIDDERSASATLIMPSCDVTATAAFKRS